MSSGRQLTERQREVYNAVELFGLRPKDVAKDAGIDESTARTHLQRAREKVNN
jgi:DNA-directed RNA polymerase specialized sigma24 family protein